MPLKRRGSVSARLRVWLSERSRLAKSAELYSDGDRYDDGQELFGVTLCPQGAGACNYGALPQKTDTYLGDRLPTWVLPPGDSPFVAAYPVIDFKVDPASIRATDGLGGARKACARGSLPLRSRRWSGSLEVDPDGG